MGVSSSRKLSTEHKQALDAFSQAQMKAMKNHFAVVCGTKNPVIKASQLPALLGIENASDLVLTALMRSLQGLCDQEPARKPKDTGPGLPDLILLKYSLERASKRHKCRTVLSMFPPSPSQQELHSIVVAFLQALVPAAASAESTKQLTSATTFITPFMTDSTSLEKGGKSWPGILTLCAAITAHYPPPHTLQPLDDSGEDDVIPAGLATPVFVAPPEAAGNELLSVAGRLVFGSLLKRSHQREWHMLFNSYIHGKSFATFYGKIANRGPTLTIVKDKKGHVFGGFAADDWGKHGKFYGSGASFLFTLLPEFHVYFATGINTNFQWCGYRFSQLPNGVGFGGQVGYYSFLIEDSLDTGMSRPSSTFGSPCLASGEKFEIDQVEVWMVSHPDEGIPAGLSGTALDKFKEDKHLLEVAGHEMHSDGYRNRPPEPIS